MAVEQRGNIAVLFQGQGVHFVGMGDRLIEHSKAAKQVFIRAEEAVSLPLRHILQDPQKLERHAQVATVVTEVALFRAFEEQAGEIAEGVTHFFGSSLGQFAAYIVGKAVSLEDGARLLVERQRLTQEAQQKKPGGMMAVLGISERNLQTFLDESGEDIVIGNHNFPEAHVISGNITQSGTIGEALKRRGVKLAAQLPIPYASHSHFMDSITSEFSDLIAKTPFTERLEKQLVPNESGEPTREGGILQKLLPRHLTDPVLLEQTFENLQDSGVNTIIEFGPGKPVFVKQLRRYYPDLRSIHVGDFGDIEDVGEEMYAGTSRS